MTQKTVVNAIVSSGLYTDPNRFWEGYMDNNYSAPELFVILKTKNNILACGTIRTYRRGWDTNVINLSKTVIRGESKRFYNPINGILFGQWKDNKVVYFISYIFSPIGRKWYNNETVWKQIGFLYLSKGTSGVQ